MKTDRRSLFLSLVGGVLAAFGIRRIVQRPPVDAWRTSEQFPPQHPNCRCLAPGSYEEQIAAAFDVPLRLVSSTNTHGRIVDTIPLRIENVRGLSHWRYATQRRQLVIRRTFNAYR